jgi:hypothetical protein
MRSSSHGYQYNSADSAWEVAPRQAPPPVTTPTSGTAVAALICGLLTLFTCGLSGPFAVLLGHAASEETRRGRRGGHGMAVAGLVLGYLACGAWAVFLIIAVTSSLTVQG